MYRAVQFFGFKNHCDQSPLVKEILDCGTGVHKAKVELFFVRFAREGYRVNGFEVILKSIRLPGGMVNVIDEICDRYKNVS